MSLPSCTAGKLLSVAASKARHQAVMPWLSGRVLDVGCGNNELAKTHEGRVWGLDAYPWEGVDLLGDATQLPYQPGALDTVVFMASLNHIPDRAAALREAHRVLRPRGRVLVTMIGPIIGWLWHRLPFRQREEQERGMADGETYGLTTGQVTRCLREGGFLLQEHIRFGPLRLNNLYVAAKDGPAVRRPGRRGRGVGRLTTSCRAMEHTRVKAASRTHSADLPAVRIGNTLRSVLSLALQLAVLGAVLVFMGLAVRRSWDEIGPTWRALRPLWLAGGVLLLALGWFGLAIVWHSLNRQMGDNLPLRKALRAYLVGQLGKYVPGKVWAVAARIHIARTQGGRSVPAFASTTVEQVLWMASGLGIGCGFLGFSRAVPANLRAGLAVLAVAGVALMLWPSLFSRLVALAARMVRRRVEVRDLRTRTLLQFLVLHCALWIWVGVGFVCVVAAVYPVNMNQVLGLCAVFAVSRVAGVLVVFAPAGMGVTEASLIYFLGQVVPLPVAITVAALTRMCLIASDLLCAGVVARW